MVYTAPINAMVRPEHKAQLLELATRDEVSLSRLVRKAIEDYLVQQHAQGEHALPEDAPRSIGASTRCG
jgi:predicted transcriptional regulator